MAAICTVFVYFVSLLSCCSICLYDIFWYNLCDCHAIIKGNLLIYLLTYEQQG